MPTFGNTKITGVSTRFVNTQWLTVAKAVLSENGLVSKITVRYTSGGAVPTKAFIYSDGADYPQTLLHQTVPKNCAGTMGGPAVMELDFSPAVELAAGTYFLGWIGDNNFNPYLRYSPGAGGESYYKYTSGYDFYNNMPASFPAGQGKQTWEFEIFGTYTLVANPYPTARLKKGLVSGFHCFLSAYLFAKITGYDPLKLPDGTVF